MKKIKTKRISFISDLHTPVGMFLRIRDLYSQVFLLESSDYADKQNSRSFICCEPLFGFKIHNNKFDTYMDGTVESHPIQKDLVSQIQKTTSEVEIETAETLYNGFFGYTSFESAGYFDTIEFKNERNKNEIPDLRYDLFKYIVVFDHFHEKLSIIENRFDGQESKLDEFHNSILRMESPEFPFNISGDVQSTITDDIFKQNVVTAKDYCQKGDVFQLVISRRFSQAYKGDDFNVYRSLRSINPSPYLFYFDYGNYRIFGSSPEAQIIVDSSMAEIHPIAGTMPRTGDPVKDKAYAEELANDPKENAEHVMLVDLARNDLSKNCKDVHVDSYKETQYFSHVMHLTSKVKGRVPKDTSAFQIFADTFPAGTLSGAPKFRAMQIIDQLEPHRRSFYGGALGYLSASGDINHAIIIRSVLSKENTLSYQAGAGIVIDSVPEKELQEVNNKLGAITSAIQKAVTI